MGLIVKCPYYGYDGVKEDNIKVLEEFYTVEMLECLKCHGIFNHYYGVSPRCESSEFVIKLRPKR